jgi:beta-N-acetylhexosaminidase
VQNPFVVGQQPRAVRGVMSALDDGSTLLGKDLVGLLRQGIASRTFPAAAVGVGVGAEVRQQATVGTFSWEEEGEGGFSLQGQQPTVDSLWDVASLTKVIATTTAVMLLEEGGQLQLDDRVAERGCPEFAQHGKEAVTIRQLLTHTSGLPAFREYEKSGITSRQQVLDAIMAERLEAEPGDRFVYSDFGPIVLAVLIERQTGVEWGAWTRANVFQPLEMLSTGFRGVKPLPAVGPEDMREPCARGDYDWLLPCPRAEGDDQCLPTEVDGCFRRRLIQGEVHDERAFCLGGAAGHAGLFSSLSDLGRFAGMMADRGMAPNGTRFLRPETIHKYTTVATAPAQAVAVAGGAGVGGSSSFYTRAIGWDTNSGLDCYSSAGDGGLRGGGAGGFGPKAFGHTGFTGTSMWIDPDTRLWCVLLTNRVHPSRNSSSTFYADVGPRGGAQRGIQAVMALCMDLAARSAML